MNKSFLNGLLLFIQDFQPIGPFYTSILLDDKRFEFSEVNNLIQPYFFYGSLITIIFTYHIILWLKQILPLIILSILQSIFIGLLLDSKTRNFFSTKFLYALTGAAGVYKNIIRIYMIDIKNPESSTNLQKIIRYGSYAISSWIGQGIYDQTHNYTIIIWISMFSNFIVTVFALKKFLIESNHINSYQLKSSLEVFREIFNVLDKRLLIASILSNSTSCLQIFLGVFSQTIFLEKYLDCNESNSKYSIFLNKAFLLVHVPIFYISKIIVFLYRIIVPNYYVNIKVDHHKIHSGYIEGTTKFLASLCSLFLVEKIKHLYSDNFYIFINILSLCSYIFLSITKSVTVSKIMYFVTLTLLICVDILGKSQIYRSMDVILISCFNLFLSVIIHFCINLFCKYKSYKAQQKSYVYSAFGMCSLLLSIFIKLF